MKIIFFGTPQFVIPVLEKLLQSYEVVAVITAPDKKSGRKQLLTPSPVKTAYQKYLDETQINKPYPPLIFTPEKLSQIQSELSTLKPDLFIVAAYGKILPNEILDIPLFGAICIHPSLLPKYRGPSPVMQTLLNGDKTTGVTFYKMDEKVDHGPIIKKESFTVHPTDTHESLLNHLFTLAADVLPDVINNFTAGKVELIAQDESKASFTKLVTKENGFIDLNNRPPKEQLENMIKAYYPWPTVWSIIKINGQETRIKFLPEKRIQIEGGKPMTIKDFLNGYSQSAKKQSELLVETLLELDFQLCNN